MSFEILRNAIIKDTPEAVTFEIGVVRAEAGD